MKLEEGKVRKGGQNSAPKKSKPNVVVKGQRPVVIKPQYPQGRPKLKNLSIWRVFFDEEKL